MERYVDEIENLKRRKYASDKELRETKDKLISVKGKFEKLKEENRRFLKKFNETKEKEKVLE